MDFSLFLIFTLDFVPISCKLSFVYPGVAQLVARLLWEQDVAGSNPVTPTKNEYS